MAGVLSLGAVLSTTLSTASWPAGPTKCRGILKMASSEIEALLSLYRSTGGSHWRFRREWDTGDDASSWHGVIVRQGTVVGLKLSWNRLQGPVPKGIGQLSFLEELDLSRNKLTGPMPKELGRLTSLITLNLSNNELEGPIPEEMEGLKKTTITWWGNKLTGSLKMSSSDCEVLHALHKVTDGQKWQNESNWDTSDDISLWYGVTVRGGRVVKLSLGHIWSGSKTHQGALPKELGKLYFLEELHLLGNKLKGRIPAELAAMRNLKVLNLSANRLTGSIPKELAALKNLSILNLSHNLLTGSILPELGQLTFLIELYLSFNKLNGPIPTEIAALKKMERLWLQANQLTGPIPKELGELTSLIDLALLRNKLDGHIPKELAALRKLEKLSVQYNQLAGPIPDELGQLTSLVEMKFWHNKLEGPIPTALAALTKLVLLWLQDNKLTGPIPEELAALSKLEELKLENNQLTEQSRWHTLESIHEESDRYVNISKDNMQGGPLPGESMDTWRLRLKSQDRGSSSTLNAGQVNTGSVSGQTQLVLPSELLQLTKENRVTLEEVRELTTRAFAAFGAMSQVESLRELDGLVKMAKHLEKVVASKIEDDNMQQRERTLEVGSTEETHYTTLRSGLCKAYLAASVVGSKLVSTCKTGAMGTAGKALKLVAGATPVFGGLASVAAAALEAGDHSVQTQRVVKIAEMASDVMECSKIAKRVALRITEGFRDGGIVTKSPWLDIKPGPVSRAPFDAAELSGRPDGLPDGADTEAVLDWFAEEVASNAVDSFAGASSMNKAVKDGRSYAEKHLCIILKAIGRDCLRDVADTDAKVKVLVAVVLQRADPRKDTMNDPAVPNRVESSSAENTVGGSGQLGVSSQNDVEALEANMKVMDIEHAQRIDSIERRYAQRVKVIKAKHAEEMVDIREKLAKLEDDGKDDISGAVNTGGEQKIRRRKTVGESWAGVKEEEISEDRRLRESEELQMLREKIIIQQQELETLGKRLDMAKDEKQRTKTGCGAGKTPLERACCSIG